MFKKQLIMQNALELFASQGIDATSIQQITERSGISKGAFYLSFKSKDELIIAMIRYFMTDLLSNLDSVVTKASNNEDLLYDYFTLVYKAFLEHANFAKVLMHDLPKTLNEDLYEHLMHYDRLITERLRAIIEKQFPAVSTAMLQDTVFFTRGLVGMYAELFFHSLTPPDNLHTLCRALVEKVAIHVQHATIPIIEPSMLVHPFQQPKITKAETIAMLQQLHNELHDDLLSETIQLLLNELQSPTLPSAIVEGLINTISLHAETKWLTVVIRMHLHND